MPRQPRVRLRRRLRSATPETHRAAPAGTEAAPPGCARAHAAHPLSQREARAERRDVQRRLLEWCLAEFRKLELEIPRGRKRAENGSDRSGRRARFHERHTQARCMLKRLWTRSRRSPRVVQSMPSAGTSRQGVRFVRRSEVLSAYQPVLSSRRSQCARPEGPAGRSIPPRPVDECEGLRLRRACGSSIDSCKWEHNRAHERGARKRGGTAGGRLDH